MVKYTNFRENRQEIFKKFICSILMFNEIYIETSLINICFQFVTKKIGKIDYINLRFSKGLSNSTID